MTYNHATSTKFAAAIVVEIDSEWEREFPIIRDPEYTSDEAYICPTTIEPVCLTRIALGASHVVN
jgi:hypothetical protein